MTSEQLEMYLNRLGRALRTRGVLDARIVEEARAHLVDAVEEGLQRGLPLDAAEREALARFGAPDTVAAHFASERDQRMNRILGVMCSFTVLATGYLSLSILVLQPPRVNYQTWFLMAGVFVAQSMLALAAVTGATSGVWIRSLLLDHGCEI